MHNLICGVPQEMFGWLAAQTKELFKVLNKHFKQSEKVQQLGRFLTVQ